MEIAPLYSSDNGLRTARARSGLRRGWQPVGVDGLQTSRPFAGHLAGWEDRVWLPGEPNPPASLETARRVEEVSRIPPE